MNEIRIDKNVAAMKLIEILLAKGMINQAIYKYRETRKFAHFTGGLIIGIIYSDKGIGGMLNEYGSK